MKFIEFPDSFLAANDAQSLALRLDFIRTYLERDVPMFGPRIPAETLERLWTMLAHSQGGLLNAAKLASSIGVSAPNRSFYVHGGTDRFPMSADTEALSLHSLAAELASLE